MMPPSESVALPVRVSVIMLTYERPQFIDRAIASVRAQGFTSWELLVVHDGPDESIGPAMRRWVEIDPRIRYLRREKGSNIANACNFALSHARGDYIAILDDDDYWISTRKLGMQTDFLDAEREYLACGGGMIVIDSERQELMRYLKREGDADIRRWALVANPIAHSTVMFRRLAEGQPVRYDETLGGFQDWDLWLRLARRGRLYNFPELFTSYTLWKESGSFRKQRANVRAALAIVKRHSAGYRGRVLARGLVSLHYLYAFLPPVVRRATFMPLSMLKKRLFGRPAPGMEAQPSARATLRPRDEESSS